MLSIATGILPVELSFCQVNINLKVEPASDEFNVIFAWVYVLWLLFAWV